VVGTRGHGDEAQEQPELKESDHELETPCDAISIINRCYLCLLCLLRYLSLSQMPVTRFLWLFRSVNKNLAGFLFLGGFGVRVAWTQRTLALGSR
jgi:hypothetical protein